MARSTNRTGFTKQEFAIFHELLLERLYLGELEKLKKIKDPKLYGYNQGKDDPMSIKVKALEIMPLFKINGRNFYEAVKNYYALDTNITLPAATAKDCLTLLGFKDINEMLERYFKEKGIDQATFKAPVPLKYRSSQHVSPYSTNDDRSRIDNIIENLENTKWWCHYYHYSVQEGEQDKPQILSIPFIIHSRLANGDLEVELKQNYPYTSFKGKVIRKYSSDNILVCEMTSTGNAINKRVYMNFHVDLSGKGQLFIGGMIRHTDNAAIRLSTFVLERVNTTASFEPKVFKLNSENKDSINPVIQDFLFEKKRNVIKIPRNIYSIEDFGWWMKAKKEKHNRLTPEYDMMITCPIRSLMSEQQRFEKIYSDLSNGLELLCADQEKLSDKIKEILGLHSPEMEFPTFQEELRNMIEELKRSSKHFKNIYCSIADPKYQLNRNIDGQVRLEEQIKRFKKCRSLLIVYPYPTASGVLFEAGWTMFYEHKIPLMIVYRNIEDLPLLIRKAQSIKDRNIFMTSLKEIGGISGISDWIISSKLERYLPEIR